MNEQRYHEFIELNFMKREVTYNGRFFCKKKKNKFLKKKSSCLNFSFLNNATSCKAVEL